MKKWYLYLVLVFFAPALVLAEGISNLHVSPTGWAMWKDTQAAAYRVTLNGTSVADVTKPYYHYDTEGLVVGQSYTTTVAELDENGNAGTAAECQWTYQSCENYGQITDLQVNQSGNNVNLSWDFQSPNQDSFYFDFENGSMQGWTKIDADGDGYNWKMGVAPDVSGYQSTYCLYSESFAYGPNVPLTPDNYIVSPNKYVIKEGSEFSFRVCAQDNNNIAEHYGVAISTQGNTNPADFTTIFEETLSSKGEKQQGVWHLKTIDLSDYAGQKVYIAIRHFDCTDIFFIDIDNLKLTTGTNRSRDVFNYTFDFGFQGWTAIDADGDGYNWGLSNNMGSWGHNNTQCVTSESYKSGVGALTPDNFLISPLKYQIGTGAKMSWFVAAQDESYAAEHYGIAVSTGERTKTEDFVVIFEETITAKGGAWYHREIDLSDYVGMEIYIAVRHFNCTNNFMINVDDVSIDTGEEGPIPGGWSYVFAVFRDGEYLSDDGGLYMLCYSDENPEPGEHTYCVRSIYLDGGIGSEVHYAMSCPECATVNFIPSAVEEKEVSGVSVSPNPTRDNVRITAHNIRQVTVYNMAGQMLKEEAVNADQAVISMSEYESGMYIVHIMTDDEVVVRRVAVAR